jgi:hypothetical protein
MPLAPDLREAPFWPTSGWPTIQETSRPATSELDVLLRRLVRLARHSWRAGTTQFRSDWSAIWLYNLRMASLPLGFEEPGDMQDIRLVVDTIPTLAWSAGPDGSAVL